MVQELRACSNLKFVLSVVLFVGNYMNGGTNRGQADGFDLDALGRLDTSKSSMGGITLLQFIRLTQAPSSYSYLLLIIIIIISLCVRLVQRR